MVRVSLVDPMETQALIQPERSLVLQSDSQPNALSNLVRTGNNVVEHSCTYTSVLIGRLYLDLANFQRVCLVEYLNHPNSRAIHFDNEDMAARDALGEVAYVTSLIPTTPSRIEELSVYAPAEVLKPSFISRRRGDQSIIHEKGHLSMPPNGSAAQPRAARESF
jgi:hypothetical protein